MKIDDAANGITLPGSNAPPGSIFEPEGGSYHGTVHTEPHDRAVAERLEDATETARAALRQIHQGILYGDCPY